MIYPYECPRCKNKFDVIKSIRYINANEHCPNCEEIAERRIGVSAIHGADDWNSAEYNPAFGKYVTKSEAKRLAKEKGLTEVGTEPVEKIHNHYETELDRKLEQSWDNV